MKRIKQLLAIAILCISISSSAQLSENTSTGQVGIGGTLYDVKLTVFNVNKNKRGTYNYTYSSTLTGTMYGLMNTTYQHNTAATNSTLFGTYNNTSNKAASGATYGDYCRVFHYNNSTAFGTYSEVNGTAENTSYGVYAEAKGTATTTGAKYSIYAVNWGSSANDWAGYFQGRSHFTSNVGIGTTDFTTSDGTSFKLAVNGGIVTNEFRVNNYTSGQWADYVFADDYELKSLKDVESYIKQNKHLPEVPSAKEVEENGVDIKEMTILHMKKIEELTLYMIELQKANEALQAQVDLLN